MSTETIKSEGLYYTVIDGTFRRRVSEDTPGATKREYETKDGAKATKYEMVVDALEGHIHDMGIHDGDFGRTLNIKLDPNSNGVNPQLQFNVETTYGEDVLKKLPGVDFTKQVKFRPFAFTEQTTGREVRGVAISQGDTKITNFFWDTDNRKPKNGLPELPENTSDYTKDDWKMHFIGIRKFLIGYFTDTVYPRFLGEVMKQTKNEYPSEELKPEDVPF